jgi:hypothetical protein
MRHLLIAVVAAAAAAQQPDPFAALRVLEGKWEGVATGDPGKGVSTREYKFDLAGKFLVGRNRSVYEPKSAGAKPEVHEDMGVFSYDRAAKKLVLRQFHGEGFVNEYALESMAADGKSFVFVTVRIENIAAGWQAKEAYRVISADEIEETFSLAGPGKDFEVYSRTRLKRNPK